LADLAELVELVGFSHRIIPTPSATMKMIKMKMLPMRKKRERLSRLLGGGGPGGGIDSVGWL
jgi:hypothetical protein